MNQPPICWCSRVFQEEKVGGTCALLPRLKSWLDKKRVPLMAAVQGGNICTSSHCLFTRSIFFSTWGFLLASNHKLVMKFSTMQCKVKIQVWNSSSVRYSLFSFLKMVTFEKQGCTFVPFAKSSSLIHLQWDFIQYFISTFILPILQECLLMCTTYTWSHWSSGHKCPDVQYS